MKCEYEFESCRDDERAGRSMENQARRKQNPGSTARSSSLAQELTSYRSENRGNETMETKMPNTYVSFDC